MMADFELALPFGVFINKMIREHLLPERSIESMKGARKQPGYNRLLGEESRLGRWFPATCLGSQSPSYSALASPKAAHCGLESEGEAAYSPPRVSASGLLHQQDSCPCLWT